MGDLMNHYEDPLVANHYQYRCPYNPDFFKKLANRYQLNPSSCVLDLCTGQGEVASQLAPLCYQVIAVDQSALMLSLAAQHANVIYLQGDLNNSSFLETLLEHECQAIFVGRGIHWLSDESLSLIARRSSSHMRYFFTVQSGLRSNNQWLADYYGVLEELLITPRPRMDTVAMDKVVNAGFLYKEHLSQSFDQYIDIDFMLGQAMSYRMERAREIKAKSAQLRDHLQSALHKYMFEGRLLAHMFSSAYVYSISR